jgi:hypothetical protein
MYQICFYVNGVKHCVPVPAAIDRDPVSPNWPELELATSVLQLVERVKAVVKDTELTRALTTASTHFIQQVQKELPKGVELTATKEVQTQTKVA